ncbi:MAG: 4Fe-4S dicluster domain-containing protein [Nitrospirae bacterium]|nr:4Fe-4S dicluster domain-containing protein [Nitrospirota bacterium]
MADWDVKEFEIMMFIDTSKCIGCKACQVSCKQWHNLPAETTVFEGSYTNPPDLSENTLTHVKFTEFERWGKLSWLFFKDQCLHCVRPKCQWICPKGVERTREGFVLFNDNCIPANVLVDGTEEQKIDAFIAACPFNIPRFDVAKAKFVKCDFCYDRFYGTGHEIYTTHRDGKPTTACELTCPPGAIITGPAEDIKDIANRRFGEVRYDYPYASLYNGNYGRTNVIFLLVEEPASYGLPVPTA